MLDRVFFVLPNNLICLFIVVLIASCSVQAQECGTVAPGSRGVPWQAGIFQNTTRASIPFGYIWLCGGSLISDNVIISSALKLWTANIRSVDGNVRPPSTFKVMVGQLSRTWLVPKDDSVQTSDVLDIHISPGFNDDRIDYTSSFYLNVNDIAIVIVSDPFRFNDFVRPACLDFDYGSELQQLRRGNKGKIVGWGSTVGPDKRPVLHKQDLDYVEDDECVGTNENLEDKSELTVRWHRDKFCAAVSDPISAICVKDYGVGIAFPLTKNGVERYYLRGVFSWPLIPKKFCTNKTFYAFTSPHLHESFIKKYWNETRKTPPKQIGNCKLPPTPEHGSFAINVTHTKVPGSEDFVLVSLTLSCQDGYGVVGVGTVHCYNGFWPDSSTPTCVRMCQLMPHPSVEYRCLVAGEDVSTRACGYYEPVGVTVSPRCNQNYYSASTLTFMKCKEDGHWDYMAKCMPECGRITPDGQVLVVGGVKVKKGEIPWHAGIYRKTTTPYMQICGGSIISNNIIISAAHCFYTDLEKQLPANQFAVAVGKIHRPWNDAVDEAQKSDVKDIYLPRRYQGSGASFQDDIAVVVVTNPFQYKTFVRPVCLNFDPNFDRLQLQTINKGKVAGWGLTAADGKASPLLRAVDLPYVEVGTCLANSPPDFREYITSDKICAGTQQPNSALCKGDSGGGLAFPTTDHGTERYYLRGVVSTAPNNDHACNTHTYTSFTQITKHENFIKPFLSES